MKYPLVKQNGFKNCGPCSLASIVQYYKGYISVDALEDMMHTTKNGTSAYNLIEAARKIGFESYGMKVDKLDDIKLPVIAHVTISNIYNHFVVIYKVDDKVLIGDPASKVKYMSKDEFMNIWNNIIITLKPIRTLPNSKPKNFLTYINDIVFRYRYTFIYLIFVSFIYSLISLIYSLLIKYIIDDINILYKYSILFISIFIFRYLLMFHKNNITINLNKKISVSLTNEINNSLISLPYVYYKNHRIGEVVSRFNDINSILEFINNFILSIVEIPFLIMYLLFMYLLSKRLFLIMSFVIFIYVIINVFISLSLNKNIKTMSCENASYNSLFIESLNGFETIKGINIENRIVNKLNDKYKKLREILCKYQKKYSLRNIFLDLIINLGMITIIVVGFILYLNNTLSIGTVISFYILFGYMEEPLNIIMSLILSSKEADNASRRIQELFYKITSKKVKSGNIEFRNVTYKSGLNYILKNINLHIKEGEKVVIIGSSGSGKSSLVKLIKGYYNAEGVYIGNTLVDAKLDNVSYVSQNEVLFEDTLYNNLMCDDNNKLDEVIKMCLVNKDLNMFIEENGFNLSGGEKARIVMARTLLKPFDILIIDESLNEVDINTERIILKNIFNKYKDKTIIVITHRLDNVDLYDHLIEIEDGYIKKDTRKENLCF